MDQQLGKKHGKGAEKQNINLLNTLLTSAMRTAYEYTMTTINSTDIQSQTKKTPTTRHRTQYRHNNKNNKQRFRRTNTTPWFDKSAKHSNRELYMPENRQDKM